jgi:hypothetical protein
MYGRRWALYLNGMVGVAGWFDVVMPESMYYIWISAAAVLVLLPVMIARWPQRWPFVVAFLAGVVVPGVLQVAQRNVVGFVIGGRYMMPLLVIMPLLGAFLLERGLLNANHTRSVLRWFTVLLLPAHGLLLLYAMMRWQRGSRTDPPISYLNPFEGTWQPPTGSALPWLFLLAGLGLLAWLFWRGPAWVAAGGHDPSAAPTDRGAVS